MENERLSPELETRLETSYARIAEDEGLTGDLSDTEAQELLAWVQAEVRRLVAQTAALPGSAAEADLTAKVAHLRRHLRRLVKASAAAADPAGYLHAHLAPPAYPEEAPVVAAVSAAPLPASEPPPLPLAPPQPPAAIAGFFRRWFGKKGRE